MALLDDVKKALRVSNVDHNTEIEDLIAAAKHDLKITGLEAEVVDETDPLIKRAIITYCKAYFGYDNPDMERLVRAYESLKSHLTLSNDYVA
jgi:uncharacterized phage protein (predicted DNA packaging)